jgi:pilus assembly protein Flp/PilA
MKSMSLAVRRFLCDEEGAAAIEYGLLVALIAFAIVVALTSVGTNLSGTFTKIASCVSSPTAANCK